jgi:hypothetical protein
MLKGSGPELRKPVRQTIREIAYDRRVRHVPPIPQGIYTAATGSMSYPDVAAFVRVMQRRSVEAQIAWMRLVVKHEPRAIHNETFINWIKQHAKVLNEVYNREGKPHG